MDEKRKSGSDAIEAALLSEPVAEAGPETDVGAATLLDASPGLPETYNETRVVLLPVSPSVVHAYWEIGSKELERAAKGFDGEQDLFEPVLRIHEVGDAQVQRAGETGPAYVDVPVGIEAGSSYLDRCNPGMLYLAELGLLGRSGRFVLLSRSNDVLMPFAEPAPKEETTWKPAGTREAKGIPRAPENEAKGILRIPEHAEAVDAPAIPEITAMPEKTDRSESAEGGALPGVATAPAEPPREEPGVLDSGDAIPPSPGDTAAELIADQQDQRVPPFSKGGIGGISNERSHGEIPPDPEIPPNPEIPPDPPFEKGGDGMATADISVGSTVLTAPDLTEISEKRFSYGVSS